MLDAHPANLEIDQIVLVGEFAHYLCLFSRKYVFIGAEMVGHHNYLFRVIDLVYPQAIKLLYCQRRSDVICQNQINAGVYEFARADLTFARMSCQNLLS